MVQKDPSPTRPVKTRWKGYFCQVAVLVLVGAQGYISYYFPSNPVFDDVGTTVTTTTTTTTTTLTPTINPVALLRNSSADVVPPTPRRTVPQYNHTFPRWGPEGIHMRALLNFLQGLPNETSTTLYHSQRRPSTSEYFPETLYIWDAAGVWVSHTLRDRTVKHQIRHRVLPPEKAMHQAWDILMAQPTSKNHESTKHNGSTERWSRLRHAVTESGGFPMIAWHGDYQAIHCNWRNYQSKHSIPLFTTCAYINCTHAFPFPTYKTIADSLPTSQHWKVIFANRNDNSTSNQEVIRKLVWRGSLSGPLFNFTSARYRLGAFAMEHADHPRLDIGIHRIPPRHYHRGKRTDERLIVLEEHLLKPMPQSQFGKYVAVLDTDGNSWSSRFGGLLCGPAVVLKVEAHYVDYFYRTLQPYEHYVPVQYDLSDLLEQAEWATDPRNAETVKVIVRNAHQWCQERMTDIAVAEDMLDILDEYVAYLDRNSSSWPEEWAAAKSQFWSRTFDLRLLSFGTRRHRPRPRKTTKSQTKKSAATRRKMAPTPRRPRRNNTRNRTDFVTTTPGVLLPSHNTSMEALNRTAKRSR